MTLTLEQPSVRLIAPQGLFSVITDTRRETKQTPDLSPRCPHCAKSVAVDDLRHWVRAERRWICKPTPAAVSVELAYSTGLTCLTCGEPLFPVRQVWLSESHTAGLARCSFCAAEWVVNVTMMAVVAKREPQPVARHKMPARRGGGALPLEPLLTLCFTDAPEISFDTAFNHTDSRHRIGKLASHLEDEFGLPHDAARQRTYRWSLNGMPSQTADALATSLGRNPLEIWPNWAEVAAEERARRLQRPRKAAAK